MCKRKKKLIFNLSGLCHDFTNKCKHITTRNTVQNTCIIMKFGIIHGIFVAGIIIGCIVLVVCGLYVVSTFYYGPQWPGFVCLSVSVCGAYIVHHCSGAEIRCAPWTCVVCALPLEQFELIHVFVCNQQCGKYMHNGGYLQYSNITLEHRKHNSYYSNLSSNFHNVVTLTNPNHAISNVIHSLF